jgi:hypothetical protein
MKYRFFTVPANLPEAAQEELNRFCIGPRAAYLFAPKEALDTMKTREL